MVRPLRLILSFWSSTKFQSPHKDHLHSLGREETSDSHSSQCSRMLLEAYTFSTARSPPGRPLKQIHWALPQGEWLELEIKWAMWRATQTQIPPVPALASPRP